MTNPMFEGPAPMQPPTVEASAPPQSPFDHQEVVHGTVEHSRGRLKKFGAAIATGALVVGGAFVYSRATDGGSDNKYNPNAPVFVEDVHYDACPNGMFVNGAYEASLNISTPGDLHTRPSFTMNDVDSLTAYFYGANGVACDSAVTEAVIKAGYVNMLGDGASKTFGFDVMGNVNEQADLYASNTDVAKKDVEKLADITNANSSLNSEAIQGAYYQVIGVKEGDKVVAQLKKVDVSFDKGTVFVTVVGGDARINNQIMVTDRTSGQIYFLNSIGSIPEASNNQQQAEGEGQANNGGGQFGTVNGSGESNQPGNVPESGGNGGATPGTAPSFGPGGGGGGEGGGTPPSTGPPKTTPPTTSPPETVPPTTTLPPKDPPGPLPPPPGGY